MGKILGTAALLGLLGPLPGYLVFTFRPGGNFVFGGWTSPLYAILWYPTAVIMFGPFCFVAALAGLSLIRLAQESPRRWLKPALIVLLPLLAGVPVGMFAGAELAAPSAIAWSVILFVFRDQLVGAEPSPGFQNAYRWLTEFRGAKKSLSR